MLDGTPVPFRSSRFASCAHRGKTVSKTFVLDPLGLALSEKQREHIQLDPRRAFEFSPILNVVRTFSCTEYAEPGKNVGTR